MAKEKNDEYSMARNQLRTAMTAIKRLMKHVEGEGELKAWVQSKLTKAADYMDSVADYMDSNDKVVKEARELSSDIHTILEAKKPKRSSSPDVQRGVPGGIGTVRQIEQMRKAFAKQQKQPLPKKPSSKPPRVSAKEQSRRNLSKALSSNQEHHVALASHRQILNSNGAELSGHSFDIMMDHSFQQAKAKHEDDKLDYFKKRSQRVDMVASHVIKALKHHSAHGIHEMISLHSGNDAILHGGHRHPMNTPMVRQARSMMHDKLKEEGLHEIAKQYAPKKPGIFRRIGQKLGLSEGYSVGEMGTDELVNRYKAMTPGQEKHKKTIETIKRVVESRSYGKRIPNSRRFPGGVVRRGSTLKKRRHRRLGRDPGPRGLGIERRLNLRKRPLIRGVGRPPRHRSRRI